MRKKTISLRQGLELMLDVSKKNPNIKFKAKVMEKWIRKYFKEKGYKRAGL